MPSDEGIEYDVGTVKGEFRMCICKFYYTFSDSVHWSRLDVVLIFYLDKIILYYQI